MSPNFLPQLAFLNWRVVERRYGGLMSASVSTTQWSEIPGRPTLLCDLIKPGLLVIQMSQMFYLWWIMSVLGLRHDQNKRCSHCPLLVAEGKTRLFSQVYVRKLKVSTKDDGLV